MRVLVLVPLVVLAVLWSNHHWSDDCPDLGKLLLSRSGEREDLALCQKLANRKSAIQVDALAVGPQK